MHESKLKQVPLIKPNKVIFKIFYETIRSRRRNSDLRLRGAERNILGSATLAIIAIEETETSLRVETSCTT
jgi:hypothetical protein